MTTKTAERKVIEYEMLVTGLWGRNRKVKREYFTLIELDVGQPLGAVTLGDLATAKLKEIKAKPGATFAVYTQETTLETYNDNGRDYTLRSMSINIGIPRDVLLQGTI